MDKQGNASEVAGRFWPEVVNYWQQLPNKAFFFILLGAWLALFQFLGNSTFGYIDTPSLLRWMYNAYNNPSAAADDGHGNLIPFVVLGLFWWKRKDLLAVRFQTWWPGLVLLCVALTLHVLGYVVQQPRISIAALFTGVYGLMGLAWGPLWLRASFFPFFLFVFCVPFGSLAEPVTFPLRLLVSKIVTVLSQAGLGIDVIRDGTRLINPEGRFEYEVAPACSGIRSLVATLALATIYAFVGFRRNWPRVVLIASAFPLAVVSNVLRMQAIVIAAELRGQQAGAYVHESTVLSLLPYVVGLGGLLLLGRWLEAMHAGRTRASS